MYKQLTPPQSIPAIVHYCWFGDKKLDRFARNCIKTWRKYLPGYKIKCWDNETLTRINNKFVQQAIEDQRWAFVADYVRLFALYHEGGIYFDTVVKLYRDSANLFDSAEVVIPTQPSPTTGFNLMSAVIGAIPQHPYIKSCLDCYETLEYDPQNFRNVVINPLMTRILNDGWGYEYEDKNQELTDGIQILDRTFFGSDYDLNDKKAYASYGCHFCNQSWVPQQRSKLYRFCKANDIMALYQLLEKLLNRKWIIKHYKK